jgi:hypothetical protein
MCPLQNLLNPANLSGAKDQVKFRKSFEQALAESELSKAQIAQLNRVGKVISIHELASIFPYSVFSQGYALGFSDDRYLALCKLFNLSEMARGRNRRKYQCAFSRCLLA